jgi:hypothetical protein
VDRLTRGPPAWGDATCSACLCPGRDVGAARLPLLSPRAVQPGVGCGARSLTPLHPKGGDLLPGRAALLGRDPMLLLRSSSFAACAPHPAKHPGAAAWGAAHQHRAAPAQCTLCGSGGCWAAIGGCEQGRGGESGRAPDPGAIGSGLGHIALPAPRRPPRSDRARRSARADCGGQTELSRTSAAS